ncbi:alpha/beta fold hydrolase [Mycoplasma simbae]|uniref:alpha/beta fold hydrolase n=1 Tax=Mycoplasma simbae TaxID=36744 RepID=UPI0004967830|nr:alpha/beta fold hydrolase [Mycoplasma simbae]
MDKIILNSSIDNLELVTYDFAPEITKPALIVQIIHGMAEHAQRYSEFARFLSQNGIKVVSMDNRGHGETGTRQGQLGHLDNSDATSKLINDVEDLRKYWKNQYPNAKYVIFGHSMGSIILRNYLHSYSQLLDAAIICGTASFANLQLKIGKFIAQRFVKKEGARTVNPLVNSLAFKDANKKIKQNKSMYSWLSTDPKEITKYMGDKWCGFGCSNQFFVDLSQLVIDMNNKKIIDNFNKQLPILLIAGSMDPIGNYGKANKQALKFYNKLGNKKVSSILYKGYRHEILNDFCRQKVHNDVYNFIKKHLIDKH